VDELMESADVCRDLYVEVSGEVVKELEIV
jgi:hypothetical protein